MMTVEVTLKLASSMDGKIALSNGDSQWITSSESRSRVHHMRANADAVVVGIGTVMADDPLLTARLVPMPDRQPARIVADSRLRIDRDSRLLRSVRSGRVIVATAVADGMDADSIKATGAEVWDCGDGAGTASVSPARLIAHCRAEGLSKIFLEGGGKLAASFILAGLVDRIEWFRAPLMIGGDGQSAIAALGLQHLSSAPKWQAVSTERIGPDLLETYIRLKSV
ncbi:MAG: RibD family protein [Henriciella sp.]